LVTPPSLRPFLDAFSSLLVPFKYSSMTFLFTLSGILAGISVSNTKSQGKNFSQTRQNTGQNTRQIGRQKGQILDPTHSSGHFSRNSTVVCIGMLFQNIERDK
jgi:hypothetical protein